MKTRELRFAVFGCGFWAPFQIAAWREVGGVELAALYNRTRAKAEALAARFGAPAVYDDPEELLARERLDFVDIITDVKAHPPLVRLVAQHAVPVICQKPMAADLRTAEGMVRACREAGVPFMVHENWRWQRPIRQLKRALDEGGVGRPFRARISFYSSFPVFENQPSLRELEQFILTDMGTHILDVARFLFGEAGSVYCQTRRVNPTIEGEDVATVMMEMGEGVTVTCELSFASRLEDERFPETYIRVECERGSVELGPGFRVHITTEAGTVGDCYPPQQYPWAEPAYALAQASMVPCNAHLLSALRGELSAETSGEDNLRTLRLVFGAYESAATGRVVQLA